MESISTIRLYKRSNLNKSKYATSEAPKDSRDVDSKHRIPFQKIGKLPDLGRRINKFSNGWRSLNSVKHASAVSRMDNVSSMSFYTSRFDEKSGNNQNEISPSGQAILARYFHNSRSSNQRAINKTLSNANNHPHHTLVNYVPFYEVRGRGDGASVVDEPTPTAKSGTEPKGETSAHIEENGPTNKRQPTIEQSYMESANVRPYTSAEVYQYNSEKENDIVKRGCNSYKVKPKSAFRRLNFNESENSIKYPPKRVSFGDSVFLNRVEEPDYVDTLLNSLNKKSNKNQESSHSKLKSPPPDVIRDSSAPEGMSSDGEEDEDNFVTPITKVTVTKRKQVKKMEYARESYEASMAKQMISNEQIVDITSKLLKYSNKLPTYQQPTQPAPSPVASNRTIDCTHITRFVQKKQVLINPSFPPQSATNRRSFMSYSEKLTRNLAIRNNKSANFKRATPSVEEKSIAKKEPGNQQNDVKPKIQYMSLDIENPRPVNLGLANIKHHKVVDKVPTTPLVTTVYASDFQPIPSSPEHINFCAPGKTEHIMLWLDDVNEKRNITNRIRRSYLTRSAR